jgi:Na+-transporting NADH:ubiquinone oxidoreductase subunit F
MPHWHVKPIQREMVYIGGGAGMAPLRAHLLHLLETEKTARKISFWYGARSKQEVFYEECFQDLVRTHSNFAFNVALSSPLPGDNWIGHISFIHEVVRQHYLSSHANPDVVEYHLCGPPMMIKACSRMLTELGVSTNQISYNEL